MHQWRVFVVLCLLVVSQRAVQAQVAAVVYDPTNFAANSITSAKSIITAAQMIISVENQLAELWPLDAIIAAQGVAEDLAALADILSQAQALAYDLHSLEAQIVALFDLETAPDTRPGLDQRVGDIKRTVYQLRTASLRVQTLIATIFRTVDHVTTLINSVAHFIGAKQGMQTLVQVQTEMAKTLAIQTAMHTSWQRADTVDRLSESLILESLDKINRRRLEGHPRY
jgi:conjugal transfer/entry exclusion protein